VGWSQRDQERFRQWRFAEILTEKKGLRYFRKGAKNPVFLAGPEGEQPLIKKQCVFGGDTKGGDKWLFGVGRLSYVVELGVFTKKKTQRFFRKKYPLRVAESTCLWSKSVYL